MDRLVQRLQREGRIRKIKVGFVQIENLLKEAILDLQEAKKIAQIAQRAAYVMTYMAMLKAGRALLLLEGYIPDDGAQHWTVVEVTSMVLGKKYSDITERFEIMRRKRNEMTYEAGGLFSMSDAQKALTDAIALVCKILEKVKSRNPQLELKFELH